MSTIIIGLILILGIAFILFVIWITGGRTKMVPPVEEEPKKEPAFDGWREGDIIVFISLYSGTSFPAPTYTVELIANDYVIVRSTTGGKLHDIYEDSAINYVNKSKNLRDGQAKQEWLERQLAEAKTQTRQQEEPHQLELPFPPHESPDRSEASDERLSSR